MLTHVGVESSAVGDRRLLLLLFPVFCDPKSGSHWMWSSQMGWSGCQQALSIFQPLSMFPLLSSPGWHCRCVCMPPCRTFLKSDRDSLHVFMIIQQALYPWFCVSNLLKYLICKIASCVEFSFFSLWNIDWLVHLSLFTGKMSSWKFGSRIVKSHPESSMLPKSHHKNGFCSLSFSTSFFPWALMCCRHSVLM